MDPSQKIQLQAYPINVKTYKQLAKDHILYILKSQI